MISEGATEEVLRHQPADLLEFALQHLCQSHLDLDVYLASPASRHLDAALAPLLNQPQPQRQPSERRWTLMGPSGGKSKVGCCRKQYCIGTWNVKSVNQGKLDIVKQEIEIMSINMLGISELKWTRKGKFNSDDHNIYYCGQEFFRRNGVTLIVNKRD